MMGGVRFTDRLGRTLDLVACAGLLVFALVLGAYKVSSLDFPWHLKAGEWIMAHHTVPRTDFFSFSREGQEWIDAQWFFQVICYGWYRLLGESGPTWFTMFLSGALLLILSFAFPGRLPLGLRGLCGLLFLLGLNSRLICRPELLSGLYMAIMFASLERARQGRSAYLVLLPLIQALWVNSEGIWPIGLGIIGAYAADLALKSRRDPGFSWQKPLPAAWAAAVGAAMLACFFQPYGLKGLLFPFTLLREVTLPASLHKQLVAEFQPLIYPGWEARSLFPPLILIGLALAVTVATGRKMRPFLFLLGIFFAFLAFRAKRNLGVGSVVFMQMLMVHLEILSRRQPQFFSSAVRRWGSLLTLISSLVLAMLSAGQSLRAWDGSGRQPGFGFNHQTYPVKASAFLKSIGYQGNILNTEDLGGYLIWTGWPEWKVFADTRLELGGEATLLSNLQVFLDDTTFANLAHRYQVEAVVVRHWDRYIRLFTLRLSKDPDWALVYLDRGIAVFLRRTLRWQAVIAQREIPLAEVLAKLKKQQAQIKTPEL